MKILMYDSGVPFDLTTPYISPLGGSETTFLLLAKGLALLNHQVVLLTNINYQDQQKNLILNNVYYFDQYADLSDVIIFNRNIPPSVMNFIGKKKLFYMSHDAYDQDNIKWMMNNNAESMLDKIICVSNWQKKTFEKYLFVDPNKLVVLGNPIDYSLYSGYTKRDNNKLIYCSIPFKGLEVLPDLFQEIKFKSKDNSNNITLDIYSSFEMYNRKEEDEKYNDVFRQLNNINGVNIFNSISMKDLAFKFKSSSLLLAPSTYHETFGRVFIEGMSGGCIPVTVNNGANKEIIEDYGYIIDYATIHNSKCFEKYVDTVCMLVGEPLFNERSRCERAMLKWDYIKLSKRLEIIIDN